MKSSALFLCFLAPVLMLLAGCSTGFEREWRSAAGQVPRDEFSGRWEGTWRSAKHRNAGGRLRCVMNPIAPTKYRASFKANWMMFTSSYSTVFDAQRVGKELRFRGTQNLGRLVGGVYTWEGRVTPECFSASYDSSYDRGTMEMGRPARE